MDNKFGKDIQMNGRRVMAELRNEIPGWEGSIGPFPSQYGEPHVYARNIHSGAGNCVCGLPLKASRHVMAAPGVPVPDGE